LASEPNPSRSKLINGFGIASVALLLVALVVVYSMRLVTSLSHDNGEGDLVAAEDVAASEPTEAEPDTRPQELRQLEADIARLGTGLNSHLGIAVVDIENGMAAHFNGEQLMPQQSVSKLWVTLTALEQADQGALNLGERGTVNFGDLTLFHQPIRKIVLANGSFTTSYADFMRRAMVGSDNTANDMLLKRVGGPEAVRAVLADKELSDIRFGPGERIMQSQIAGLEWDQSYALGKVFFEVRKLVAHDRRRAIFDDYISDPVDGASALALAQALARLAKGELLSAKGTRELLGILRDAKSGPNRLKGGLPKGWQIGHKTGTGQVLDIVPPGVMGEQAGYNDIGILTAPNGSRYAVAVMIGQTVRPVPERMDMMHGVVGAVVTYHNRANGLFSEDPVGEDTVSVDAAAS
jgi:beta-lactamase class A